MVTKLAPEENGQKEKQERNPATYRLAVLLLTTLAQSYNSIIVYEMATHYPLFWLLL